MATADFLKSAGALTPVGVIFKDKTLTTRVILATEIALKWLQDVNQNNPVSPDGFEESPKIQLYNRFKQYQVGPVLVIPQEFHPMLPLERSIWVIKTADIRMYGFFTLVNQFVCTRADWKWRVAKYRLASVYIREAEDFRYNYSLRCITGTGVRDVLH